MRLFPVLLLCACTGGSAKSAVEPNPTSTESTPEIALNDLSFTRLDGAPLDASELDDKVVLFVNVASRCGFTPQYEGLQALHERYAERGLRIVGVPCNQFGGQEPGGPQDIATFCKANYGVTFTLLEKQDVNGADRSPLYDFLVDSAAGEGKRIKWNFEKFLVGRSGEVLNRWNSRTTPDDSELVAAIEAAL